MKNGINIKRRIGSYIKRNHVMLLAFFLPAIILEIAYLAVATFPVGNGNILTIDLYHQYAPFISDLRDKLTSSSSLLYSWSGGLGINYLPLYAYYLASPLNLIVVLFPRAYLTEAVLVLTLLKVGLSGASFAFYLKGVQGQRSLPAVVFSLLYALSGYVLIFSWNIMWMDSIYLLPLIMLGLVKIVRDGEGLFYCIVLAAALLCNFYMGFFICFFTLLYYPVCFFKYHSGKKLSLLIKRTAKFAGYSLLAAGLSAVLLLPTYFQLKLTSAADDTFPKTLTNYFDLFNYITRNFTAASPSILEGMPNLYSGIIVLILLPIYFLCKGIHLKEKLLNLSLLLILILSFNMNILNFIWHGFHYPNQIPYRFSFVYIFLVVSMCSEAFTRLQEFSGKQIGTICLWALSAVFISQKFDDLSVEFLTVYASAAFVILYGAALTADRSCNIRPSRRVLPILFAVIAELTVNTIVTIADIDSTTHYTTRDKYASGTEVAEIRRQIGRISKEEKDFYRLEILPTKTTNDPALYNYPGLSLFSSTAPEKPVKMFRNLGYSSNSINSYRYEGSTAILDSLFGIKYVIYRGLDIEERLYDQTAASDGLRVFTNPYALSLGFQAPVELSKFNSSSASNPFKAQNLLVEDICGVKDILTPIDQKQGIQFNLNFNSQGKEYYSFVRSNKDKDSSARIQFVIDKAEQVYLYYKAPSDISGSGFVIVNGKKIDFNSRHSTIINLGFCEAGTSAELNINLDKASPERGTFEVYACSLNMPEFVHAMSLIREKSMTVEEFTDTRIRGKVEASEDGLMILSIPFDKGWHVKVDNQVVETQAVDDCLLSFELSKGSHKIELRYFPEKLSTGLMITSISLIMLLMLHLRKKGVIACILNRFRKVVK